ncbi:uncharacterized protein LOC131934527 [Physella acuta]|uniref:uncharacterized protein LOC131934527 n=1 Tax=Physella acuta TaxID=109671 RepID=UPI0027DB33F2|nr:uncharacterized protein LOC131934527 [Physella acuta]
MMTSYFMFFELAVVLSLLNEIQGMDFIFGSEAKRVCEAYKLICPAKKVCALQTIEWPSPMKFPVCVHRRHFEVKSRICRKAPEPGRCGAKFMRWYFNVHMGACSWFTYSGCGGNENNFRTAEECEARCTGTKEKKGDKKVDNEAVDYEDDSDIDDDFEVEINDVRPPKFITAPAKAAEVLETDNNMRASLVGDTQTAKPKQRVDGAAGHKGRKNKKGKDKKQKKNKKRNNAKKQKLSNKPRDGTEKNNLSNKDLPPLVKPDLVRGNETKPSNYLEMRSPSTMFRTSGFHKGGQLWLMDGRFKKPDGGKRKQKRKPVTPRAVSPTDPSWSGVEQDKYYDRVTLFNILRKDDRSNPV